MKNIILILLLLTSFVSCKKETSMLNHKESVVVGKYYYLGGLMESSFPNKYYLTIREKKMKTISAIEEYVITEIRVPRTEYNSVEIGDTIN